MVKQIIKEAMEKNPLGLKETVAEELRARVALALEAKMEEMSGVEEAEQIDEISKELAHNYYRKASKDIGSQAASATDFRGGSMNLKGRLNRTYNRDGSRTTDDDRKKDANLIGKYDASRKAAERKIKNRALGLSRASARLESFDLEEAAKWELNPATYMVGGDLSYDDKLEYTLKKADSDVLNRFLAKASDAEKTKVWSMFWDSKEAKNKTAQGPVNAIKYAKKALKESVELEEQNMNLKRAIELAKKNHKPGDFIGLWSRDDDIIPSPMKNRNTMEKDGWSLVGSIMNDGSVSLKKGFKEEVGLEEAKMTDAEVLSAAKSLAANGKDPKTKAFGKGLVDFYKKEGSFTPAQVGGLQNIMKSASFQMAKDK